MGVWSSTVVLLLLCQVPSTVDFTAQRHLQHSYHSRRAATFPLALLQWRLVCSCQYPLMFLSGSSAAVFQRCSQGMLQKDSVSPVTQHGTFTDSTVPACAMQVVRELDVPEGWPATGDNDLALLVNETVQVLTHG
jgi:hypothetical protein